MLKLMGITNIAKRFRKIGNRMRSLPLCGVLIVVVDFTISPVLAAESGAKTNPLALNNQGIYEESLAALTLLFVVAVLLENAFSTIFNWRVFLAYFNSSGVKTIIMVIVALIVVNTFDIDVMAALINAYKKPDVLIESGAWSKFITALILAGGSAGVYNLMRALGYRSERREAELEAKPPPDKAWLAIRVDPRNASGDVQVKIQEVGTAGATSPDPIAGTITFRRKALGDLFFRRPNRFPQSGGYVLKPGTEYSIAVLGRDANGAELKELDQEKYVFAPGAIVDFNVTL